jgi:hypothetical protein
VGDTPLATPIVKVLRALHGPESRRDVRNDVKLPSVPQDVKMPPDQEKSLASLIPEESECVPQDNKLRLVRNDVKLPSVQQDAKLPPDQEPSLASLIPRVPEFVPQDIKLRHVRNDVKLPSVQQDAKLPPDQETSTVVYKLTIPSRDPRGVLVHVDDRALFIYGTSPDSTELLRASKLRHKPRACNSMHVFSILRHVDMHFNMHVHCRPKVLLPARCEHETCMH